MGCQQWQPFAYTHTEALQTLLTLYSNFIDKTQKAALARLYVAVSVL
nr:MAG TPA: hypothetical protein [Caudoviricetes sp.]